MKNSRFGVLAFLGIAVLIAAGLAKFLPRNAAKEAERKALEFVGAEGQKADTAHPRTLERKGFRLEYPSNWKIDEKDEDYDPDRMFSIESPGSAFVMIAMVPVKVDPEEHMKGQIDSFANLMGAKPSVARFETYGRYKGKGASLKGKVLGVPVTVKAFACFAEGATALVVQQVPDEDIGLEKDGLDLIEKSFVLIPKNPPPVP
ncbi:MAG: hypothetical protein AAB215_01545 [Planctomycetota bacterium]|mgnify:CR=1 FL=1